MLRLHYLLIGILLLFIAETARAQQEFIVKNLGLSDGLPLNAVNDIAQDSSGYIYFATNEGLVRYDGYHMVTYNTASVPILNSNRISRLVYDKSHMLWLSHYSGEITSFDGRQFTTYGTSTGLGFVYHSFEDHQGNFWVVSDIGLFEYQRSDRKFKQHPIPADSDEMTVFARDYENGLIGFSADGTLWSFKSNSFKRLTESVIPDLYYSTARIYSFDSTYIWFATSNGFYAINRQNGDIAWSLSDDSISKSVFPLADGRYVLASGYSFYYVDPRSFSLIQEPFRASHLLSPRIVQELEDGTIIRIGQDQILYGSTPIKNINKPSGLFLDRNRTLWVASQTDGVYMVSQSRIQNLHELDGKPLVNVYSMYECTQEPGVFRFASYDSGIFEFGPDQNRILNSESSNLPEGILQYIYQDKDRNHYAGYHRNGLWRQITPEYWQRTSEIDHLFNDIAFSIFGMYEHPANDQFFIGTNLGLAVRTGGEWREVKGLTQESLRSIRSFSQMGDFVLLGSATSGMYILQADLQITQQITDLHGLSSNSIRDIFVQSPDTVWIVTENAGLNRLTFRDDGTFQISGINHLNGLPHNSVHRMIADTAGRIWISSNRGIFSTSLHSLNTAADNPGSILSFLTLDESSGMLNREANGGVSNSGLLTKIGRAHV
jgi:ligand-binding sensor domain-containing protein